MGSSRVKIFFSFFMGPCLPATSDWTRTAYHSGWWEPIRSCFVWITAQVPQANQLVAHSIWSLRIKVRVKCIIVASLTLWKPIMQQQQQQQQGLEMRKPDCREKCWFLSLHDSVSVPMRPSYGFLPTVSVSETSRLKIFCLTDVFHGGK